MTKKEYNGESTRNARIKIDYQGKKPQVKFSYPNIKDYTYGLTFTTYWLLYIFFITMLYFFLKVNNFIRASTNGMMVSSDFYWLLKLAFFLFGVPILIYIVFSKFLKGYYPKLQAVIHILLDTYYKITLKNKDVKCLNNLIYAEIPMFHNIFLDYDASEDFSKYLKYFEIKEYPFKEVTRYNKLKEEKATDVFWYARFYFTKIPQKGKLEVKFK